MYNKIVLVGNLTRDIEMRFSQGGLAIAKSAIATSRKFKSSTGEQKEEVCFVDITFFGRSAEVAHQYLHKGSKILVEGRLHFDQWTDQNGQKRSKHGVNVDVMQMLDGRNNTQAPSPHTQPIAQSNTYPTQSTPKTYVKQQEPKIPSLDVNKDMMNAIDELDEVPPF